MLVVDRSFCKYKLFAEFHIMSIYNIRLNVIFLNYSCNINIPTPNQYGIHQINVYNTITTYGRHQ